MPSPLVSIVTPSYNQGRYIQATLDSVLKQDYTRLEHLVMDGGSSDETLDILRNYTDTRLQWVSEPDKGQTDALNKGLRRATGDILAYLNSDDLYLPGAVAFAVDYFDKHPEVAVIYGDCQSLDAAGQEIQPSLKGQPFNLRLLFTTRLDMPQPTVFWRRRVLEGVGFFDESLHYTMDYDYWLRMVVAGFQPMYVPGYRAAFRMHNASKTGTEKLGFWRDWEAIVRKIYAMPNLPPAIAHLRREAFAYVHFYGVDLLWAMGQYAESRPLLRDIILQGTWRPRLLGTAMYIDTLVPLGLTPLVRSIYSRAIGTATK